MCITEQRTFTIENILTFVNPQTCYSTCAFFGGEDPLPARKRSDEAETTGQSGPRGGEAAAPRGPQGPGGGKAGAQRGPRENPAGEAGARGAP